MFVWSSVRTALTLEPKSRTSLNSWRYRSDPIAGGGPGRNWLGDSSSNGSTCDSHGAENGAIAGGVGRQTPGANGTSKTIGAKRPSSARSATKWSAARSPYQTPRSFDTPSGICASDVANDASRLAATAGGP